MGARGVIPGPACYLQLQKSTNQLEHEEEVPSSQPYPIPLEILRDLILEKPHLDPLIRGRANQPANPKARNLLPKAPRAQRRGAALFWASLAVSEGKGRWRSLLDQNAAAPGNEGSGTAVAKSRGQETMRGRFHTNLT